MDMGTEFQLHAPVLAFTSSRPIPTAHPNHRIILPACPQLYLCRAIWYTLVRIQIPTGLTYLSYSPTTATQSALTSQRLGIDVAHGEVSEWLMVPLSKSGVAQVTVGSNPTLSAAGSPATIQPNSS